MDTTWIGAASALAGVAVTSAADAGRARNTFRREKAWALFDDKRRRLEDIYQALEAIREVYALVYGRMLLELSASEGAANAADPAPAPWARLRMLINLYTPELRPYLGVVEKTGPELGSAIARTRVAQIRDDSRRTVLLGEAHTALMRFTAAADLMRDMIVHRSGELGNEAEQLAGRADGTPSRAIVRRRLRTSFSRQHPKQDASTDA